MNKDFRVAITIATHCKTKKLMRRLGDRSFYNLIRLWAYTAANKPDGKLLGMSKEDIELAAGWNGQCSEFVLALLELNFIDETDNVFSIHNWEKHNGYAFHAQQRSEKAQKAAEARWNKKNKSKGLMLNDANSNAASRTALCPLPSPEPDPEPEPEPEPDLKKNERKFNEKDFLEFYSAYPNPVSKKAARERWKKLLKKSELPGLSVLLVAIKNQSLWRKDANGEFRPEWKHPATWLNGACWEDEAPGREELKGFNPNTGCRRTDNNIRAGKAFLEEADKDEYRR